MVLYKHLKRMDPSRISKQIFDMLDQRPKTNSKWFEETKKGMQEKNIKTEHNSRQKHVTKMCY